ncbi:MAG: ATP-binding protein, partial [Cyanobacteria bacterium P01_E01_bin.42]
PRFIYSDELKLRQVLINLINNAIKFTHQGGINVRVETDRQPITNTSAYFDDAQHKSLSAGNQQPTTIHFEVEDTGVGIAAEEMDLVFEAFGQSQSGLNSQEGTGLGLPISRKFIQLMGGDIQIESQVAKGTTLKFDIRVSPAKNKSLALPKTKKQAICLAPDQPVYRLLVVDDKPLNRKLLIKLLSPFGFECKEAKDGLEAIEIWQAWQPHLIWMDLRMPVMNGYDAAKKIRTFPHGQSTVIIAITASLLEEQQAVIFDIGFDNFIRKPFREENILTALEEHVGVKFIYEENELLTLPNVKKLTAADLDRVPEAWLAQFSRATLEGDIQQLHDLIETIRDDHSDISQALQVLADRYELEQLLELTERGGNS